MSTVFEIMIWAMENSVLTILLPENLLNFFVHCISRAIFNKKNIMKSVNRLGEFF